MSCIHSDGTLLKIEFHTSRKTKTERPRSHLMVNLASSMAWIYWKQQSQWYYYPLRVQQVSASHENRSCQNKNTTFEPMAADWVSAVGADSALVGAGSTWLPTSDYYLRRPTWTSATTGFKKWGWDWDMLFSRIQLNCFSILHHMIGCIQHGLERPDSFERR